MGLHRKQMDMKNLNQTSNALPGSAWRRLHWLSTSLLALGLATPLLAESLQDKDDGKKGQERGRAQIVQPDRTTFGKTYAEWGVEWYKWDLGNPISKASSLDPTGANSTAGQSGPVWFLAGKSGDQVPVTRDVVVPEGKHIFFPLINIINDYPCPDASFQPAPGQTLEQFLAEFAKAVIDTTVDLAAVIDGDPVADIYHYRAASKLFNFIADPSWKALDSCITGTEQQGVADGYWLMLKPLSVGKHTIKLRGKNVIPGTPPFPFGNQNVTLNVTVVRPARVYSPDAQAFGTSYSKLAVAWWDWAFNQPPDKNPVVDATGAFAGVGQDHDYGQGKNIFFLAGSFGGADQTVRRCTIPKGKALFFPIVNSLWITPEECSTLECRQISNDEMDKVTSLECKIDGLPVGDLYAYRAQSPPGGSPFHIQSGGLVESLDPVFYAARGYLPGAMADGYWLLVKLDDSKEHTIEFSAARGVPTTVFQLSVKYILTVANHKDDDK